MAPSEFKSQQAGQLRRELGALRETHAATERQHALDIAAVKAELRKERAGAAGKCPTCAVRKTVNVDGKLEYVRKTVNARCPAAGSAPRCGGQGKSKSAGGGKALAAAELTTHLTFDRLPKLMAMLERWQGGVVAAVVTADAEQEAALRNFSARWGGRLNLVAWRKPCSYPFNYPVNFLRNLATDAARADVVLGVDVDFVPSAGLHGKLVAMARAGAFAGVDAFAVPAFLALPGARLDDQAALLRAVANHTAKPILTAASPQTWMGFGRSHTRSSSTTRGGTKPANRTSAPLRGTTSHTLPSTRRTRARRATTSASCFTAGIRWNLCTTSQP